MNILSFMVVIVSLLLVNSQAFFEGVDAVTISLFFLCRVTQLGWKFRLRIGAMLLFAGSLD